MPAPIAARSSCGNRENPDNQAHALRFSTGIDLPWKSRYWAPSGTSACGRTTHSLSCPPDQPGSPNAFGLQVCRHGLAEALIATAGDRSVVAGTDDRRTCMRPKADL